MSLMGTALGRMAYGASQLANKYIDEEMALNRATRLAEIRRASEVQTRKDIDQYENDPARRANVRAQFVEDKRAEGAVGLENEIAKATNPALREAAIRNAGDVTRAQDDAKSFDLSPGQERYRGGTRIASNDRPTAQEVQKRLYEDGMKGNAGKLSEAGKEQLKAIDAQDKQIQELINKGVSDGTLSQRETGPDGKPLAGYDQFRYLQKQRQDIGVQRQRVLAREGVIDGGEDAQRVIDSAPTAAEVRSSMQLATLIGGKYASDFKEAMAPVLKEIDSPEYKRKSIAAAAKESGDKNYDVDIGAGGKYSVRNGVQVDPNAPVKKSLAEQAAEYVPPPDSPVGKARAKMAADTAQREQQEQAKRDAAAQSFLALDPKDRSAAARLQASDQFRYLTPQQQREIYDRVNGR